MVTIEHLSKNYNGIQVLSDISFSIESGCITGLFGKNGAGKTTIIKHLVKLLTAESGAIACNGTDIYGTEEYLFSYIPDEPVYFEELTVMENILFMMQLYRCERKTADELMNIFDFMQYQSEYPPQLSRGSKQKLMIILALLRKFDVLIADEPFTALDPEQTVILKNIFLQLKVTGKTILLSTHQLDLASSICDRFVFIDKGRVVYSGNRTGFPLNEEGKPVSVDIFFNKLIHGNQDI
jgi:ABC-2 type transport system ATP-binding protein